MGHLHGGDGHITSLVFLSRVDIRLWSTNFAYQCCDRAGDPQTYIQLFRHWSDFELRIDGSLKTPWRGYHLTLLVVSKSRYTLVSESAIELADT
ncbi:MAG: hypothetical protein M0019_00425 [Actinomycetota bacterium]|nr:hypothetical protein [Actinomycetota bacterium]